MLFYKSEPKWFFVIGIFWCPIFESSPLIQNSKFNNLLWVCWLLWKNLSIFVPLFYFSKYEKFCCRLTKKYDFFQNKLNRWVRYPVVTSQNTAIKCSQTSSTRKETKTRNFFFLFFISKLWKLCVYNASLFYTGNLI